jgi:hypothetical protein
VSRLLTVTGLALRELWISFRLLAVVGAFLLAALPTALLPHAPVDLAATEGSPLAWFALGLAATLALAGGLAGATMAAERRRGSVGWLTTRAVPRPVVLLAWFLAFTLLLVIGLVPSAGLAWLSLGEATQDLGGAGSFVAPIASAWAAGMAGVAVGLLLGSLLPPVPAGLLALVRAGGLLLPATSGLVAELAVPPAPGAGLAVLGGLYDAARPVADSLRAGGVSLVVAAAALVLGAAALARADL